MRTRRLAWTVCMVVIAALLVSGCAGLGTDGDGLTPARDLTGTWKTAIPVVFYTLNVYGERAMKVTANLTMVLKQTGSSVTGTLTVTPVKQEAVGEMPIPEAGGPNTIHKGVVSSTNFTFEAQLPGPGESGYAERWTMTFTTDLMQGTVTNLDNEYYFGRDSDTNAIKLVKQ